MLLVKCGGNQLNADLKGQWDAGQISGLLKWHHILAVTSSSALIMAIVSLFFNSSFFTLLFNTFACCLQVLLLLLSSLVIHGFCFHQRAKSTVKPMSSSEVWRDSSKTQA